MSARPGGESAYEYRTFAGDLLAIGPDDGQGSARVQAGGMPRIPADDLPAVVTALYAAAGKPAPVVLELPEQPCDGLIPGVTFAIRHGGVDIGVSYPAGYSGHLESPRMIRRFAASLAILAGEAECEAECEPDPDDVTELAEEMRGEVARTGGNPREEWEIAARTALRWMRDREHSCG